MKKILLVAFMIVLLVCGAGLLWLGSWARDLQQANQRFSEGDNVKSAQMYHGVLAKLPNVSWLRQALGAQIREAILSEVVILYREKKYQDGIRVLQERADQFPFLSSHDSYHFWLGNLLFQQALIEKAPESLIDGLRASQEEYQKALEQSPHNWDYKHNFEVVKRIFLLGEKSRQPEEELELLLEEIRTDMERRKRELPPEKRG
ncbi:MAG: hypothetical protein HY652_00225 [Acidobacteria bacterium]|nr:hypothetical protein [Acidobacteriota bacterium]